ncbi:hypothetical protein LINGRAHAP2_LOCUS12377 [Linum grandiflorum]
MKMVARGLEPIVVFRPVCYLATLMHYSRCLPRDSNLNRFVRPELLRSNNVFFFFLAKFVASFW